MCLCVCVCALLPGGCQTIKWHGSSQHKNRASRAKSDDGISARGLFALSLSLGVIAHGTYQCGGLGFCEWFQRNGSLLVEGRGEAEAVVSKHRLLVVIPTRFPTSLEPNCRLFSLSHTPSSASSPIVQAYGIIAAHIIIHRPHPPRLHRLSRVRRRLRPCSVPGRQRWQLGEWTRVPAGWMDEDPITRRARWGSSGPRAATGIQRLSRYPPMRAASAVKNQAEWACSAAFAPSLPLLAATIASSAICTRIYDAHACIIACY